MQMPITIPSSSLSGNELLVSAVSGAVAFPAILGLGQLALFKPLRLTCSSRLASLCGGASVVAAGCIASLATVKTVSLLHQWKRVNTTQPQSPTLSFGAQELLVSTVASAFVFRAFGGRFSSVLPSHLLKPGAFAREWIPVKSIQSTERQRRIIQQLGKTHGCHSCGKKRVRQFIADHQPPTKIYMESSGRANGVNTSTTTQRLYPHCRECSRLQGSLLTHSNGSRAGLAAIRSHPFSLRVYHLFLPIPFVIAYLKSEGSQLKEKPLLSPSKFSASVKETSTQTLLSPPNTPETRSSAVQLSVFGGDSSLARDFPLFIIWKKIVYFIDSFPNSGDAFHITLWAFAVIAALGVL